MKPLDSGFRWRGHTPGECTHNFKQTPKRKVVEPVIHEGEDKPFATVTESNESDRYHVTGVLGGAGTPPLATAAAITTCCLESTSAMTLHSMGIVTDEEAWQYVRDNLED